MPLGTDENFRQSCWLISNVGRNTTSNTLQENVDQSIQAQQINLQYRSTHRSYTNQRSTSAVHTKYERSETRRPQTMGRYLHIPWSKHTWHRETPTVSAPCIKSERQMSSYIHDSCIPNHRETPTVSHQPTSRNSLGTRRRCNHIHTKNRSYRHPGTAWEQGAYAINYIQGTEYICIDIQSCGHCREDDWDG